MFSGTEQKEKMETKKLTKLETLMAVCIAVLLMIFTIGLLNIR